MSLPPSQPPSLREIIPASVLMLEKHFSIDDLAARWSVSRDYVTDLFIDEPGVIRSPRKKSGAIRIPFSVVERVYKRMLVAAEQAADR